MFSYDMFNTLMDSISSFLSHGANIILFMIVLPLIWGIIGWLLKKNYLLQLAVVVLSSDGVGIYFIEQLSRTVQQDNMLRDNILLIAGSTAPENFTGEIKTFTPSTLFIVDAACMGLTPGETKIIPASDISGVSFSTHMMPLSVLLNYLEAEIGCNVVFIGIQPESTEPGFSISEDVKKGAELLAKEFSFAFVHYLTRRTSLDNR